MAALIYIPTTFVRKVHLLHLLCISNCQAFHFRRYDGCIFHNGFHCVSLMTNVVEPLFITLLVLWVSSFVKNLSHILPIGSDSCLSLPRVLYMFWIQVLCQICVLHRYSPTLWLTFSLSMVSFDKEKFFLMWFSLWVFCHYDGYFKSKSLFLPYNLLKWHLYSGILPIIALRLYFFSYAFMAD